MENKPGFFKKIQQQLGLAKPEIKKGNNSILPEGKKRASYAIKQQPKREVSFEISDIKGAKDAAQKVDQPIRTKLCRIYEYILEDGHLSSQIEKIALQNVLSEPFALFRDGKESEEETKLIQKQWMEKVITAIFESELWGFRLIELYVEKDNVEFVQIANEQVCPEQSIIWLDVPWSKPWIAYEDNLQELSLLFFGDKKDLGILRKAAYNVLWKYYARSDWSRASEKFGMPILHIKANTNQDAELDRLEARAASFGTDGYMVTQAGDDATIIERAGQDIHKIYLENINYCDEQLSKLINGQTATSDTKAYTGSAEVQERQLDKITLSRLRKICYNMNDYVIPYLVAKGYLKEGVTFDYPALQKKKVETKTKSKESENKPEKPK